MSRPEAAFLLCANGLVIGLTAYGYALGYPGEALFFPVLVSVCLLAFTGMRLIEARREARVLATPDHPATVDGEEELEETASAAAYVRPFVWIFAIIPALYLLGYQIGLPVYVFIFLMLHRVSLAISLAVSVGTAIFVYVVFSRVLQVLLPAGLIGIG
jgi:hypothetical protein